MLTIDEEKLFPGQLLMLKAKSCDERTDCAYCGLVELVSLQSSYNDNNHVQVQILNPLHMCGKTIDENIANLFLL